MIQAWRSLDSTCAASSVVIVPPGAQLRKFGPWLTARLYPVLYLAASSRWLCFPGAQERGWGLPGCKTLPCAILWLQVRGDCPQEQVEEQDCVPVSLKSVQERKKIENTWQEGKYSWYVMYWQFVSSFIDVTVRWQDPWNISWDKNWIMLRIGTWTWSWMGILVPQSIDQFAAWTCLSLCHKIESWHSFWFV